MQPGREPAAAAGWGRMRFQTPEKKSEKTISGKHAPLFCRFGRIFYLCGFDPNFMTPNQYPQRGPRAGRKLRGGQTAKYGRQDPHTRISGRRIHRHRRPVLADGGIRVPRSGRSARIPAPAVGRGIPAGTYTGGIHRSRAVHGQQRRTDAGGARPPVRLGQSSAQLDARVDGEFSRGALLHLFSGGSARRAVVGNVAGSGLQYCAGEGIAAVEHGFPARRGRQLAGMSGRMARNERQRRARDVCWGCFSRSCASW